MATMNKYPIRPTASDEDQVKKLLIEIPKLRHYITYLLIAFVITVLFCFPFMLLMINQISSEVRLLETKVGFLERARTKNEITLKQVEKVIESDDSKGGD